MEKVQGFCPMGCGEKLFLGAGGHVTCARSDCPRPTAADEILATAETHHIATIRDDDFSIEHPLRERLDGALHHCMLHQGLSAAPGPPAKPGRYRVTRRDPDDDRQEPLGGWDFKELA